MSENRSDSNQDAPADHVLMRRIAAGDRAALATLVRRHQATVLRLAYRVLGRWDDAEDVAQEAFLRVLSGAGEYRPEAQFSTWLYRIVSNLCLDERRRWARRRRWSLESAEISVDPARESDQDRRELQQRVQQAVADLPQRQRLAVVLHRFEGLNHAEIAEITGWSASAVESCLVRAYAGLRQRLAGLRDD